MLEPDAARDVLSKVGYKDTWGRLGDFLTGSSWFTTRMGSLGEALSAPLTRVGPHRAPTRAAGAEAVSQPGICLAGVKSFTMEPVCPRYGPGSGCPGTIG